MPPAADSLLLEGGVYASAQVTLYAGESQGSAVAKFLATRGMLRGGYGSSGSWANGSPSRGVSVTSRSYSGVVQTEL